MVTLFLDKVTCPRVINRPCPILDCLLCRLRRLRLDLEGGGFRVWRDDGNGGTAWVSACGGGWIRVRRCRSRVGLGYRRLVRLVRLGVVETQGCQRP